MAKSGVTSSPSAISLPANGVYGSVSGNTAQSNEVSFSFPARAKKAKVTYQAYNSSGQVSILVNGVAVGYAGKTKANKWGGNKSITIPKTYLSSTSSNTITFKNNSGSSSAASWGVRNVKVK